MKSLTQSAMKRIIQDWANAFADFGVIKPMWLMRRNGPLIIGVLLERDSSNIQYTPTFHVHNLCETNESLSLSLARPLLSQKHQAPEAIVVKSHKEHFDDALDRFQQQNPILLTSDLTFDDVSQLFTEEIHKRLHQFPVFEFRDLAQIAAYLNLGDYSEMVIGFAAQQMKSWPVRVIERIGGIDHWVKTVSSSCADRDQLIRNVESEIEVHELADLPTYELSTGNGGVRFRD